MTGTTKTLGEMRREPANVSFIERAKVCEAHFGQARQSGTSHKIFKTPRMGDPRINIQNEKGKPKACQVKQVLLAIQKLKDSKNGN